jgi:exosortase
MSSAPWGVPILGRVLLAGAIFCGLWIGWDAVSDIAHVAATESEASHVWIVPVVFCWLFWIRRNRVTAAPSGSRWPGALAAAAGVAFWWVGYRFQIQSAWHFGAVAMIAGAGLAVVGADYLWQFLPAWGATLFLVPVPNRVRFFIAQPLETLASAATQSVCEVIGFNVGRSGNQLSVNGVDVCVAEACNGMRLVFTLFLACYVAVFIRPYRAWVRVAVLAVAPIVAVAANVVRLVPTLWMFGHHSAAAAERFHEAAGIVMVLLAFLAIILGCDLLQWIGLPVLNSNSEPLPTRRPTPKNRLESAAAAVVVLALGIGAVHRASLPRPSAAAGYQQRVRDAAAMVPISGPDWVGTDIPIPQDSLDALKTNVAISRRYLNRSTGQSVDLLILQSADIRDLVPHYPPVCYPGQGLVLTGSTPVTLTWRRTTVVANRYTFEWHDFRRGDPVVVDNFMVLPTGQTQPDTAGMERRIGTDYRYFGCAQVQVVYRDVMTPQERTAVSESVLAPYLPLLAVIESGTAVNP